MIKIIKVENSFLIILENIMKVIVGCIVRRNNKILIVKEVKKSCYGQLNYPIVHLEELEEIAKEAISRLSNNTMLFIF